MGSNTYQYLSKIALRKEVVQTFARDGELHLLQHLTPEFAQDFVGAINHLLPSFLLSFAENPWLTRLMPHEFSVRLSRHEWVVESFGRPIW